MIASKLILIAFIFSFFSISSAESKKEVMIAQGVYTPFFRDKNETDQMIGPLLVDKYSITNQQFQYFLKTHPEWQKSQVKNIFANSTYLEHWQNDLELSSELRHQPVTNISWFAARAYCQSQGQRLLRTAEWEYVSDSQNPHNLELILKWYGETGEKIKPVSKVKANAFGLVGMHGLIWEWVDDFSSSILMGDSRSSNETSQSMFCGSGSLKAKDPSQYATFMRFAHRSSLRANSVGRNLGFRCAKDFIGERKKIRKL